MLERYFTQHSNVVNKYVEPTNNYYMSTTDYVVRPSATAASGPITITLPNVTESAGRFYSILARAADVTNTITITDKGDSENWTNVVLNAADAHKLLYSDGMFWHVL